MFSDLTLNISDLVKSFSLVEICDSYVLCLTALSDTLQLQLTTAEFGEDDRCYSFLSHSDNPFGERQTMLKSGTKSSKHLKTSTMWLIFVRRVECQHSH